MFVSDKCLGLVGDLAEFYPEAKWQHRVVHFYRNPRTAAPSIKKKEVTAMLRAILAQEDAQEAKKKLARFFPWHSSPRGRSAQTSGRYRQPGREELAAERRVT